MKHRLPLLVALGVTAFTACSRPAPRDVVIVTLDTFRADRMETYGGRPGVTPSLDALARSSAAFLDASAPTPITLPSHASLFTGRYPTSTGVRNNGTFVLPTAETTLAETLRAAGWATIAVVASYPVRSTYGLAQGFETYDEDLPKPQIGPDGALPIFFNERDARAVTDRALAHWNRPRRGPRFLWAHYFDAHAPYAAPEPWRSRFESVPYDAEVAYMDAEVGRLLKTVRESSPEAIVVVVADHGESLGEHGEKTHGIFLYQATIRVPFLLAAPGLVPGGTRVSAPVSLVDVMPTVLSLAGVAAPAGVEGADLRPLLEGKPGPVRPVYAESFLPRLQFRFSELTMLRRGPLKYVEAPEREIYDVLQDPGELRNLHGGHPDAEALAEALAAFTRSADPEASQRAAGGLDPEAEAKLRSLGYASAGTLRPNERGESRRDPKTMTDYMQSYDRAVGLIANGRFEEGTGILAFLVPRAPENYMARYQLAAGYLGWGRLEDAEAQLETVVRDAPEFGGGHSMLGAVQGRLGKIDDAVRSYRAAVAVSAAPVEAWLAMARLLESAGRFAEAADACLEATRAAPDDPKTSLALLALRAGRGEVDRGIDELRRVLEASPRGASTWAVLASALRRKGDLDGAAEAIRRALEVSPDRPDAVLLAAEIAVDRKRFPEAESAFRTVLALSPDRLEAGLGLARALAAQGRREDALAAVDEVLRRRPEWGAAITLRQRIHGGAQNVD